MSDPGISPDALSQYIADQILTLPGVQDAASRFTVILSGSRATGAFTPDSDVDIEVFCERPVFESVLEACVRSGLSECPSRRFFVLPRENWQRYFGERVSRPHFSLAALDDVERHVQQFDDVHLWIYTHARVLRDPGGQFSRIVRRFQGYPQDVLVRKLKYRWLLNAYWALDVFPLHHSRPEDTLPALTAVANAVNEWLRLFFLVEARPFPYTERLVTYAQHTRLGKLFLPHLLGVIDLALGRQWPEKDIWTRLDEADRGLCASDECPEYRAMEQAGEEAMLAAGVEPEWVKADYGNIDQLLSGELGPVP